MTDYTIWRFVFRVLWAGHPVWRARFVYYPLNRAALRGLVWCPRIRRQAFCVCAGNPQVRERRDRHVPAVPGLAMTGGVGRDYEATRLSALRLYSRGRVNRGHRRPDWYGVPGFSTVWMQHHKICDIATSHLASTNLLSYGAVCYSNLSDGGAPALVAR